MKRSSSHHSLISLDSCLHCFDIFPISTRYRKQKYCSQSCASSSRTGERAANWQGGKTSAWDKLRTSRGYKAWRTAVFERDGYTCVHCGDSTGGNLEADHIRPRSLFPSLTLDVDNGRTLCRECHKKTDTWGKKLYSYKKKLLAKNL